MSADIIDGKAFAAGVREQVTKEVAKIKAKGVLPCLAVILVGEDPASQVYVRNKGRQTEECGMKSLEFRMDAGVSQAELLAKVRELNEDSSVHGILVQLPLSPHMDEDEVIQTISPDKDVDGFHLMNVGKLSVGNGGGYVPCTPYGCLRLLQDRLGDDLSGKHAVVIGRSNIVGKPMAALLLGANCTVTIAHSRTKNLAEVCKSADILVAAVGRAKMVGVDYVKDGAVVIDVGINQIEEGGKKRLVGDVDFDSVVGVVGGITPVPGGVGPLTIAMLLRNTCIAACRQNGLDDPDC